MTRQFKRLDNPRGGATGIFGALAVAFTLTLGTVSEVSAQESGCLSHDTLERLLDERYTEKPAAAGLEAGGRLIQLYTSADSGSWTMVITTPAGESCVIAIGENWQEFKRPAAKDQAV